MTNANYKKWLFGGAAILLGSTIAAFIGVYWGIYSSFAALKTNESASIDAVQGGIETALYLNLVFAVTGLIGMVFMAIGSIKAYRYSKSINENTDKNS